MEISYDNHYKEDKGEKVKSILESTTFGSKINLKYYSYFNYALIITLDIFKISVLNSCLLSAII